MTDLAADKRAFRMAITGVLIDHALALDERRQQRTATTWPDESDIYTDTIARLTTLFKRKLQADGWTPPKRGRP